MYFPNNDVYWPLGIMSMLTPFFEFLRLLYRISFSIEEGECLLKVIL